MEIRISEEERQSLSDLLEKDLKEMRKESNRTDSFEFKEMLHHREALLAGLIEKLEKPVMIHE
jgi:hypothetical protein